VVGMAGLAVTWGVVAQDNLGSNNTATSAVVTASGLEPQVESVAMDAGSTSVRAPASTVTHTGDVIELPVNENPTTLPPPPDSRIPSAATNLIAISLEQVPVQDVVNMFSQISGANIIMCGAFTNHFVTASLKNVEWKAALSLSLGSVNLSMIEDVSGILMVVTAEKYADKLREIEAAKPLITKTYTPRYLSAVDLVVQVMAMKVLSPRGTIITSQSATQDKANLKSGSAGANTQNPSILTAIVITDIKEYLEKAETVIRNLDRCEPQVLIEARIIDVGTSTSEKVGFDWEMLDKFGFSAGVKDLKWNFADTHVVDNSTVNSYGLKDTRENTDKLKNNYDLGGNQYEKTEVISPGYYDTAGNYVPPVTGPQAAREMNDSITRSRDVSSLKTDTKSDNLTESKMGSAFLNVTDVSLFLSAIKRDNNTEMLSHPVMIVGNKVEAKIHVGEQTWMISLKKDVQNTGAAPQNSYSETATPIDLGLKMWVIPEIDANNDSIRLSIEPEMTVWVKDITTPQGSVYPVISTRRLTTRVNVPSGLTVVIGGLVDNKKTKVEKSVPILGDIPLIGLLFRHTEDAVSKHNLLIMLTPTILDPRKPVSGYETTAQQTVDKFEKVPQLPSKSVVTNLSTNVAQTVAAPASTNMTGDTLTVPSSSANLPASAAAYSPYAPAPVPVQPAAALGASPAQPVQPGSGAEAAIRGATAPVPGGGAPPEAVKP